MNYPGHDNPEMLRAARVDLAHERLSRFVKESNRIERIYRDPTPEEIRAHSTLLGRKALTVPKLIAFVDVIQPDAVLRREVGKNVRVVNMKTGKTLFRAPEGGPEIVDRLAELLDSINENLLTPAEAHAAYETLHPFTDGNGCSGRAIWAWQIQQLGEDPFELSFLRAWYYQSLDLVRRIGLAPA